jgi:hypothetical protein
MVVYHIMVCWFQVWLNDENSDQRHCVTAKVAYKSPRPIPAGPEYGEDYVLLRIQGTMPCPVLDAEVYPFAPYVLVGASARSQEKDPSSTRHGFVLSTRFDRWSHMLGDTPSELGDSGGGCFLLANGALFAICVGRRENACILLPISVPYSKAMELESTQLPAGPA